MQSTHGDVEVLVPRDLIYLVCRTCGERYERGDTGKVFRPRWFHRCGECGGRLEVEEADA